MPSTPHMNGVIYQKQSDHFEKIAPKIAAVSARNVGELVYSLLPLDDTGLHLLDGSVLYGNGPYADFVDYIQGLYTDGNHTALFETEADWQSCVTTYGACGKFVVDMTNDTVRLPKLSKGFLEATIDASALGDLVEAGLPNITGQVAARSYGTAATGGSLIQNSSSGAFNLAIKGWSDAGTPISVSGTSISGDLLSIDASNSSSIYGSSSTVQPQSIKGFIYMVLANKVRNPMNFDASQAVRGAAVPVGTIIMSANAEVPQGYLLCDGSAVGRGTYPELFEAIGTTYGTGDGSTTFNLPDLIGKFLEGGTSAGVEKEAGLPNIEASVDDFGFIATAAATSQLHGAAKNLGSGYTYGSGTTTTKWYSFDASLSNPIYGNSTTVQPEALTCLPCIKAFSSVVSDGTVVIGNLASEVQAKNDEWVAHNAMPSGQYISLTLPTSDGTVTAPADGWICFKMISTGSVTIGLTTTATSAKSSITMSGVPVDVYIPVAKNDIVTVFYGTHISSATLTFTYANGSAPSNP